MSIQATIVLDSINVATGSRLTTFAIRVPKFLLAQIGTHRSLSKNSASSRAIPAKKIRKQVIYDPVVPVYWGRYQKGMQADKELEGWRKWVARQLWLKARYPVLFIHWLLADVIGLHKEVVNRLVEPWMWADVVISGTEWKNFFALRCHKTAQPEFQDVAKQMYLLMKYNIPQELHPGEWHLPFVDISIEGSTLNAAPLGEWEDNQILDLDLKKKISAARCARVSYLLPEGGFSNLKRDIELCDRLIESKHLSPFEHVSVALPRTERSGNFIGFRQWRKDFINEANGDYESSSGFKVEELDCDYANEWG